MAMKSPSGSCRSKTSMRSLLALVALWAALDVCLAEDDVVSRHGANSSNAHAAELSSEKTKEAFSKELCQETVKKVQETGKYTEESIVPICSEIMKSPKCDFFAEALSLASSHPDFESKRFCVNMDEAHFCMDVMDKLLTSLPVSDLAFGECERAQKTPDEERCRKMKQMLTYAVQNEDLDTLRACYMVQAFTNLTMQEMKDNERSPNVRIITSSSKELDDAGKGRNIAYDASFGKPDIVLQPVPLEPIGNRTAKGKLEFENVTAAAPAGASQASGIIVEPVPVSGAAPAGAAPAGAPPAMPAAAPASAAALPTASAIIAEPQPAQAGGAVLLHAHNTTRISAVPAHVVKQQPLAAEHQAPATAAAKPGNEDQSLVPRITAVQLVNSTKVVQPAVLVPTSHNRAVALSSPAQPKAPVNGTSAALKQRPADPSKPSQLPAQKGQANTARTALRSTGLQPARSGNDAAVAASRPAVAATTAPPAPLQTAANVTASTGHGEEQPQALSNSSSQTAVPSAAPSAEAAARSMPSAAHRRTGLAQARLVAQAHRKEHHKEEARKEVKGDYNGFLSKFVAA